MKSKRGRIEIIPSDDDIDERCNAYGETLQLLDPIFSVLNTHRHEYNMEKVQLLKNNLELLRKKWNSLQLSFTPKVHTLLDHSPYLFETLKGFAHMSEERLERAHQSKARVDARLVRLRNLSMQDKLRAQHGHMELKACYKVEQKIVMEKQKRNLKRSKREENAANLKKIKEEKREYITTFVSTQETKTLLTARETLLQLEKNKQGNDNGESRQSNNESSINNNGESSQNNTGESSQNNIGESSQNNNGDSSNNINTNCN